MRLRYLIILLVIALGACATTSIRAEFDNNLEYYNELIRWQNFDRTALFSYTPTSEESTKRIEAAKKARVIDYKIVDVKYSEQTNEVSAVVEFSYYLVNYGTVKKVIDNQKWIYIDKSWKLTTPLPEFR